MFDSELAIVDHMIVIAPVELLLACEKLEMQCPDTEFSILTKIEKEDGNEIYLSPEYYIPKQEVSAVEILYGSDEKAEGYDVVVHKHPDGCLQFSQVDKEYINQNHKLSILYTKTEGFVNKKNVQSGMYNMKLASGVMFPLPIQIELDYRNIEAGTENISEIEYEELNLSPASNLSIHNVNESGLLGLYPNSGVKNDATRPDNRSSEFGYYDKSDVFHYFADARDVKPSEEGVVHVVSSGIQLCEELAKLLKPTDLTLEEWHLKCKWTESMLEEIQKDNDEAEDVIMEQQEIIDNLRAELLEAKVTLERLEADAIQVEIAEEMEGNLL